VDVGGLDEATGESVGFEVGFVAIEFVTGNPAHETSKMASKNAETVDFIFSLR
jgi:hypothetical protein